MTTAQNQMETPVNRQFSFEAFPYKYCQFFFQVSAYNVNVAHQQDCHLNILKSEDHTISHESRTGAQFLTIEVISVNGKIKPFTIR